MLLDELLPLAENVVNFLLAAHNLPLAIADKSLELLDQAGFQFGDPLGVNLDL
ncbi:MAG: hypothetical protein WA862_06935 [Solirubrobacterales bacterium]